MMNVIHEEEDTIFNAATTALPPTDTELSVPSEAAQHHEQKTRRRRSLLVKKHLASQNTPQKQEHLEEESGNGSSAKIENDGKHVKDTVPVELTEIFPKSNNSSALDYSKDSKELQRRSLIATNVDEEELAGAAHLAHTNEAKSKGRRTSVYAAGRAMQFGENMLGVTRSNPKK